MPSRVPRGPPCRPEPQDPTFRLGPDPKAQASRALSRQHSECDNEGDDRNVVARSAAAIYSGAAFSASSRACCPAARRLVLLRGLRARHRPAHRPLRPARPAPVARAPGSVRRGDDRLRDAATAAIGRRGDLHVAGGLDGVLLRHRGTVLIVGWIGVVHGARCSAPAGAENFDRWIDVVGPCSWSPPWSARSRSGSSAWSTPLDAEARIDPLTGLLNRRGLEERLVAEAARAARDRRSRSRASRSTSTTSSASTTSTATRRRPHARVVGAVLTAQVRGADAHRALWRRGVRRRAARRRRSRPPAPSRSACASRSRHHQRGLTVSAGVASGPARPTRSAPARRRRPGALRRQAHRAQPHRPRAPAPATRGPSRRTPKRRGRRAA